MMDSGPESGGLVAKEAGEKGKGWREASRRKRNIIPKSGRGIRTIFSAFRGGLRKKGWEDE